MNYKFIFIIALLVFLTGCSNNNYSDDNWELEIQNLIQNGCNEIQYDVDENTCFLNEEKTDFNLGCSEMLTTKKLELPKCISLLEFGKNCKLLSGTMNEEVYYASEDAILCKENGCYIKERGYHEGIEGVLDTGWIEFECISK
jgi:hypothetical protein